MIIFINGAFGSGKTTVAQHLNRLLPDSLLFDPEEVGYFLRNVLEPIDEPDDFQHYPMWRTLVVTTARLLRETYGRTLIMPMTIHHGPYFDEVVGGLRGIEPEFHHFCLIASTATIHERLERRGETRGGWAWSGRSDAVRPSCPHASGRGYRPTSPRPRRSAQRSSRPSGVPGLPDPVLPGIGIRRLSKAIAAPAARA